MTVGKEEIQINHEDPKNPLEPVKTGDTNNWWLWVLMLLSGGYLVEEGIHYSRKKRDSRK